MQQNNKTHSAQAALANYCRSGHPPNLTNVRKDNLPQYRRLIRNIFVDTLSTAYPITCDFLSTEEWENLVDNFMMHHSPSSPQVWHMPRELWEYVSESGLPLTKQHPFFNELLWFEWLEIELYMMKNIPADYNTNGNIEKDKLVLNPEHSLQIFQWPVFLKHPNQIKETDKGHYFLVMFRHPDTGSVHFLSISPYIVRLLEMLEEEAASLPDLIANLSIELKTLMPENQSEQIRLFFQKLLEKKLVLGYS